MAGVVGGGQQEVAVGDGVGEAVGGQAGLAQAQRIAAPAHGPVLFGDEKAVFG